MSIRENENYYLERACLVPGTLQEVSGISSLILTMKKGVVTPSSPRARNWASKKQSHGPKSCSQSGVLRAAGWASLRPILTSRCQSPDCPSLGKTRKLPQGSLSHLLPSHLLLFPNQAVQSPTPSQVPRHSPRPVTPGTHLWAGHWEVLKGRQFRFWFFPHRPY